MVSEIRGEGVALGESSMRHDARRRASWRINAGTFFEKDLTEFGSSHRENHEGTKTRSRFATEAQGRERGKAHWIHWIAGFQNQPGLSTAARAEHDALP